VVITAMVNISFGLYDVDQFPIFDVTQKYLGVKNPPKPEEGQYFDDSGKVALPMFIPALRYLMRII